MQSPSFGGLECKLLRVSGLSIIWRQKDLGCRVPGKLSGINECVGTAFAQETLRGDYWGPAIKALSLKSSAPNPKPPKS